MFRFLLTRVARLVALALACGLSPVPAHGRTLDPDQMSNRQLRRYLKRLDSASAAAKSEIRYLKRKLKYIDPTSPLHEALKVKNRIQLLEWRLTRYSGSKREVLIVLRVRARERRVRAQERRELRRRKQRQVQARKKRTRAKRRRGEIGPGSRRPSPDRTRPGVDGRGPGAFGGSGSAEGSRSGSDVGSQPDGRVAGAGPVKMRPPGTSWRDGRRRSFDDVVDSESNTPPDTGSRDRPRAKRNIMVGVGLLVLAVVFLMAGRRFRT